MFFFLCLVEYLISNQCCVNWKEKEYVWSKIWELGFIWQKNLGLQAKEVASQVTLRQEAGAGHI